MKIIFTLFILLFDFIHADEKNIERLIERTDYQYNKIIDYEVDIQVSMKVPAFRMPKKKYKVFYKQPDLIKVKSKGFGILPKTGI